MPTHSPGLGGEIGKTHVLQLGASAVRRKGVMYAKEEERVVRKFEEVWESV
jgi:hypothetical protein